MIQSKKRMTYVRTRLKNWIWRIMTPMKMHCKENWTAPSNKAKWEIHIQRTGMQQKGGVNRTV